MMKSFFKKLSLTMALAMVVTTAAPAAQASAAEASVLGIALQDAASKSEVKSTFSVGTGVTVDLKYYGAPKNYKTLNPTWSSSNEKVATVDKNGIVTGVAEGVATITIALSDGSQGSAKVIVGDDYSAKALGIALQEAASKEEIITEAAVEVEGTVDLKYYGAPSYYKQLNPTWVSSDEEIATVDKNGVVTGVADGVAVIIIKLDNGQFGSATVTVGKGEVKAEEMTPAQKTAYTVQVDFTNPHTFDATGTDNYGAGENTVKVYRVFSTDEMAKMANKNGLKFDEEGRGYQAYYVQDTIEHYYEDDSQNYNVWTIEGYDAFVDGALYAVVYGANETSSTIDGIVAFFTAYVGKVAYIELKATEATVENEVEPAIPAYISARLYNAHGIDLTSYYKNADETDYELLTEDLDVSLSGNEVTFDEPGYAQVKGTYTFYDEDKEEDVPLSDEVTVKANTYSTYRIDSIYNWTLASGYGDDGWATTTSEMIAGDEDQLYVIVKDNRGNYYSNVPGIENWNNGKGYWIGTKQVLEIGNGDDNTAFEQYGYELVFDSLDPDSLLVDPDGYVTSYKKTNSFAVVSYRRADDESAKLYEIGVMGITVKAPRKIDSVNYVNGTSFTVLKETEAEDGISNYYSDYKVDLETNKRDYVYKDFNLVSYLEVEFLNQYGKTWGSNAEDWGEVETNFTVTTSKDDFDQIAGDIADALNAGKFYEITSDIFEGKNTTSVTFKIKESATGDSESVTIKLDKPKYVTDANGDETDVVYVDPSRAIMNVGDVELYLGTTTQAKLFQVSKANQKVGYVRIDSMEINLDGSEYDEDRRYFLAEDLVKNIKLDEKHGLADFITTASTSALASGMALDLNENDFILVVTDPNGKVVPSQGNGGNGLAINEKSNLGIVASEDGTYFELILAAYTDAVYKEGKLVEPSVLEYAAPGTYRATVYKVTNVVTTNGVTKYTTTRVSSDSFTVSRDLRDASFFHQEETKDVSVTSFLMWDATVDTNNDNIADGAWVANEAAIKKAVAETMTFRLAGQNFNVGYNADADSYFGGYWSYMDYYKWGYYNEEKGEYYGYWGKHWLNIELVDIDYKVQDDGNRAVINTVTFEVETPAGWDYVSKVKVNRSVNVTND